MLRFAMLLSAVLAILKLTNTAALSWYEVLAPVLILIVLAGIILIATIVALIIREVFTNHG